MRASRKRVAGVIGLASSFWAAVPVAFTAGFLSFVSPCVLPLLPGYLGFLGGSVGGGAARRGRTVAGAALFVLGFSTFYVSTGALFGAIGISLKSHQRGLDIVLGVTTIVLGLVFAGFMPNSRLLNEKRSHFVPRATLTGALLMGFLFAVGWSPCLGPTLAAIQGLALRSASEWRGAGLSFVYCLGLGVPFIVTAITSEWALTVSRKLHRHLGTIARVGGLLLVGIGVLEVTGLWHTWVVWLQDQLPSVNLPL
jgi:cytochrome c-type biogenesis protein